MSAPNVLPTDHVLPGTARVGGLRRRPTGAPPPLPRKLGWSGKLWLALAALLAVALVWLSPQEQPRAAMDAETAILRAFAGLRSDWLTPPMRAVASLGTAWSVTILGGGLVLALIVFKRWRHLVTFLVYLTFLGLVGTGVYMVTKRPRPYGVTIIGDWIGFSMPSFPVAILAACLMGIAYALVVPGRPRGWAKLVITVVLVAVIFARLYLAVDHPTDVVWAAVLGVAVPLGAFRWFTPNEAFPVTYRRGKTAHLDVTGARGDAIRQAVQEQLGLTVLEIKPIGLEASGGSTPLRLRVAGDPDSYIFAKLYAKNHVRADRWYKLGRKILYGSLEDETSFQNVRRFVQYEDYTLRLMHDMQHPERGLPGDVPAGQDGPPGRHRRQRRRDPAGHRRPARAHGPRGQTDRAGGVRRVHTAAAADRRRPGQLRLRQALRQEPRAGRSLVQARPDDPVRRAGGRDLVPDRPPVRPVRGLHPPAHARTRNSRSPRRTGSPRSRRSAST